MDMRVDEENRRDTGMGKVSISKYHWFSRN